MGVVLGVAICANQPLPADVIVWDQSCESPWWDACCTAEDPEWMENNWSTGESPAPWCPPLPSLNDDAVVEGDPLEPVILYLMSEEHVNSFSLGWFCQFTIFDGELQVNEIAEYNSPVYWLGGTIRDGTHNVNVPLLPFDSLTLSSAAPKYLAGAALLNNNGTASWVDGPLNLAGGTFSNAGTFTWSSEDDDLCIYYGSAYNNLSEATFDVRTDADIVKPIPNYPGGEFINEGTFTKYSGQRDGTTTVVPLVSFDNDGTVVVESGLLELRGGGEGSGVFSLVGGPVVFAQGTYTLGDGACFTGDSARIVGDVNGIGHVSVEPASAVATAENVALAGGYLEGAGTLIVTNRLDWTDGTMSGTGQTVVAPDAALDIDGDADKVLWIRHLINHGDATWTGLGDFQLAAATFDNLGTFDIRTDADLRQFGSGPPYPTINNEGTFTKHAGGDDGKTEVTYSLSLVNHGLLEIESGSLCFEYGYLFEQTAGATTFLNGGSLEAVFGILTFAGGLLTGSGALQASVASDAEASPGSANCPAGQFEVIGDYTQGVAGAYTAGIGGHMPGTEYDRFLVSGWAFLDGTMNVGLVGGFLPDPGDSFELMTYLGHTGQFATVHLPPPVSTRRFGLFVEPTSVVLRVGLRGDLNCDGSINFGDINPFVLILSDPAAWQQTYPGCPFLDGDINGDGRVNFGDINPFVALLSGGR
jgi:hypothetical protein